MEPSSECLADRRQAGGLAANSSPHDTDLVIAVGTRLGDFVTSSKTMFQDPDVTFVGININGFDAAKLRGVPAVGRRARTPRAL